MVKDILAGPTIFFCVGEVPRTEDIRRWMDAPEFNGSQMIDPVDQGSPDVIDLNLLSFEESSIMQLCIPVSVRPYENHCALALRGLQDGLPVNQMNRFSAAKGCQGEWTAGQARKEPDCRVTRFFALDQ